MRCTVVVCTWNRADLLDETLASLGTLAVPPGVGWELLLVDNASTDHTRTVADRHAPALPLRYLVEPRQGLSHARNRAIESATGDLILWTDDDVLVDPGWLAAHVAAAEAQPATAFQGGPVLPRFLADPPAWIARNLDALGTAYALRDLGSDARPITAPDQAPFGANMATRRRVFADGGLRFDPALGRTGANLASGEETRLFRRLLESGETGAWVPAARVRHALPPARLTRRYLRDYFHWSGRTEAREGSALGPPFDRPRLERRRRRAARHALLLTLRRDRRWAEAFATAHRLRGLLDELGPAGG